MCKVPRVTGREAIAAFERVGFSVVRVRGAHHIMKKAGHQHRLSIPVHGNKTIGVGLLGAQTEAAGLTIEHFVDLLGTNQAPPVSYLPYPSPPPSIGAALGGRPAS